MDYNLEVCHHLAHNRPIDEGVGVVLSHHCLCHEVVERGKPRQCQRFTICFFISDLTNGDNHNQVLL